MIAVALSHPEGCYTCENLAAKAVQQLREAPSDIIGVHENDLTPSATKPVSHSAVAINADRTIPTGGTP